MRKFASRVFFLPYGTVSRDFFFSCTHHIPLKQGGGGASYRQNGRKHKWYGFWVIFDEEFEFQVYFGESAPYGGHPPHIYPSNRVEGVQVTTEIDENTIGMGLGVFGQKFEFWVHFGHSTPDGGNPPKYTGQTGWEGGQPTLKMGENTICIVLGRFGQGIRISSTFWSSDPTVAIRPPMAVIHPKMHRVVKNVMCVASTPRRTKA